MSAHSRDQYPNKNHERDIKHSKVITVLIYVVVFILTVVAVVQLVLAMHGIDADRPLF